MAGSSGKPGAVHFTLIFFVMLSVILGVVAYMKHSEREELSAKIDSANKKAAAGDKAVKQADSEIHLLKRLTEQDVIAACRDRLAGYKIPKVVRFHEQLPLSPQGKILKKELVQYYRDNPIEWDT